MFLAVLILSFLFLNLPLIITITDLTTDKEALLYFSNSLPSVGEINWKKEDPSNICTTWIGIKCTNVTKMKTSGRLVNCTANCTDCTNCEVRVTSIHLPGKGLFGPIVANSIGKLDALQTLNLRSNVLYGTLPPDIFYPDYLEYLILSNNRFCGSISSFKKPLPPRLMIIDFSYNSFTGSIPYGFKWLVNLANLSLQNNNFMEKIPDNITLTRLRRFNNLVYLNLSNNEFLQGQIPYSLQNFSVDSFIGNPQLCGKPLNDCSMLAPAQAPLSRTAPLIISHKVIGAIAFVAFSVMILLYFPV